MNNNMKTKILAQNINLPSLGGKATIAKSKLFDYLDSDFKNYGTDVGGAETKEATVEVRELTEDGTFKDIFTSITPDLDTLCLTQAQILHFVEHHKDQLTDWYTFFLFKVKDEFFVADVDLDSDGFLRANVFRFSCDGVWGAEDRHRFVVAATVSLESSAIDPQTLLTFDSALKIVKNAGYKVIKEM